MTNARNKAVLGEVFGGSRPVCIEFGESRKRLDGWITVDVSPGADICLDLSQPLPMLDGSVARIYSSHLLEHLDSPALCSFTCANACVS
jgi:predicted SAM-dependent methyltransferase